MVDVGNAMGVTRIGGPARRREPLKRNEEAGLAVDETALIPAFRSMTGLEWEAYRPSVPAFHGQRELEDMVINVGRLDSSIDSGVRSGWASRRFAARLEQSEDGQEDKRITDEEHELPDAGEPQCVSDLRSWLRRLAATGRLAVKKRRLADRRTARYQSLS